jgi:hypothetical protein
VQAEGITAEGLGEETRELHKWCTKCTTKSRAQYYTAPRPATVWHAMQAGKVEQQGDAASTPGETRE